MQVEKSVKNKQSTHVAVKSTITGWLALITLSCRETARMQPQHAQSEGTKSDETHHVRSEGTEGKARHV